MATTKAVLAPVDQLIEQMKQRDKDLWVKAKQVLTPFLDRAETGNYPLQPKEKMDKSRVTKCIETLINVGKSPFELRHAGKLQFVSWSKPFPNPDSLVLDEDKTRTLLEASLRKTIIDRFDISQHLRQHYISAYTDAMPQDILKDILTNEVWIKFYKMLKEYECINGDDVVEVVVAAYMKLLREGEYASAQKLADPLEVLLHCLPLGCTKKDSTWIVLCA